MKIADLPNSEKPRERLLKYGASYLSNEDLIAIILRNGVKDQNVKILSSQVLTKIKSIDKLSDLSISQLSQIKGIGKIKAITLLAAIELGKRVANQDINEGILINNTDLVHKYFSPLIGNKKQEEVLVILLNHKKRLLAYQIMYKGTNSSSLVSAKEMFNYAIKENADAIIIMHNHPSKMIEPSKEDYDLTNTLIETGKIIGIPLLDHLITNGKEYYSFFNEMVHEK